MHITDPSRLLTTGLSDEKFYNPTTIQGVGSLGKNSLSNIHLGLNVQWQSSFQLHHIQYCK